MTATSGYWIVLTLCVTGLAIRMGYEFLKAAGKIDPRNKVVLAIVVAGMSLFLPAWYFLGLWDPWQVNLPVAVSDLGTLMAISGAGLALLALFQLRGVENIDHLVTGGIFKHLRHPMYSGFILWILGWMVSFGAGLSFFAGVMAVGCVLWWRRLEEEKMMQTYGEEYEAYRKRTWF